ncbi:MAG: RluA family pseudouridine synthase [Kofleriaceae bacterium]|nr:RluA family pseudouridine synthase [Kofleriaceae bacterium]
MPSPFAHGEPHPLARRAAEHVRAELAAGLALRLGLDAPGGGKMFGVLVVADRVGRVGFLRAFSGMAGGTWNIDGYVAPAFDEAARDAFWIAGEAELDAIAAKIDELDVRLAPLRSAHASLVRTQKEVSDELRERQRLARAARHAARAATQDPEAIAALDRESSRDSSERRRIELEQRDARRTISRDIEVLERERAALDGQRAERSRGFLVRIHDTYALANARGETKLLRALFAPAEPPGGAGDCAAPKLVAEAFRRGLRPIALAELWVGASPPTGDRKDGTFYPACRGKCAPILAHMLDGIAEPPPTFGGGPIAADEPRTVFEDAFLAIVDKPIGLLSVPGRGDALRDCVLARLRARYPAATGPILVHRLDLDTSGLLVAAKDKPTYDALQRMFSQREITKRYTAWLDGVVAEDSGTIDLPLRVDIDDRPRQVVDHEHGLPAVTEWKVLARDNGRTRVAMFPKTGRTHQLRVHAAVGLGAPIVGDRLYGRPDARLMLHAEALAFVHPHTGETLTVTRPAPF